MKRIGSACYYQTETIILYAIRRYR
jgi:hypothetical protein